MGSEFCTMSGDRTIISHPAKQPFGGKSVEHIFCSSIEVTQESSVVHVKEEDILKSCRCCT